MIRIKDTTCTTGTRGEAIVCQKLEKRGFRILKRNMREKFAEIDIVAKDGDTLCFIEVRTRQNTRLGHPVETVTHQKQQSIRRAAEAFLSRHNVTATPIRFDVATIVWDGMEFEYFENAF